MGDDGQMGGMKHDEGKTPWHKLLWDEARDIVRVIEYGDKKYAPGNWRKVDNLKARYFDAALRHMLAWKNGEMFDESGLPHLAHAMTSLMFLAAVNREERYGTEGTEVAKTRVFQYETEDSPDARVYYTEKEAEPGCAPQRPTLKESWR